MSGLDLPLRSCVSHMATSQYCIGILVLLSLGSSVSCTGNSSSYNSSSSDSPDNSFLSSSSRGQSVADDGALAVRSARQEQHGGAGAGPVGAAARVPSGGRLASLPALPPWPRLAP